MRTFLVLATAAAVAVALVTLRTDTDDDLPTVAGGDVTLVGDSLNVGTEPYLRDELAGWSIEAYDLVGRATAEGVEELRRVRAALAPIVVVSLGTNDADGTEEQFRALVAEALRIAGDDRCVVWATVVRDGNPRDGFNAVLGRGAGGPPEPTPRGLGGHRRRPARAPFGRPRPRHARGLRAAGRRHGSRGA